MAVRLKNWKQCADGQVISASLLEAGRAVLVTAGSVLVTGPGDDPATMEVTETPTAVVGTAGKVFLADDTGDINEYTVSDSTLVFKRIVTKCALPAESMALMGKLL